MTPFRSQTNGSLVCAFWINKISPTISNTKLPFVGLVNVVTVRASCKPSNAMRWLAGKVNDYADSVWVLLRTGK